MVVFIAVLFLPLLLLRILCIPTAPPLLLLSHFLLFPLPPLPLNTAFLQQTLRLLCLDGSSSKTPVSNSRVGDGCHSELILTPLRKVARCGGLAKNGLFRDRLPVSVWRLLLKTVAYGGVVVCGGCLGVCGDCL